MNLELVDGILKVPNNKYADYNEVYPFKGRTIDTDKPIRVYRNLHRQGKWYSIKQDGKVVAHSKAMCIRDCTFIVSKAGKERAIRTKQRDVHAFIEGFYETSGMGTSADRNDLPANIKYDPFNHLGFYCDNLTSKAFEVKGARFCIINHKGVGASYLEKYN
jgi:hypothetical protein